MPKKFKISIAFTLLITIFSIVIAFVIVRRQPDEKNLTALQADSARKNLQIAHKKTDPGMNQVKLVVRKGKLDEMQNAKLRLDGKETQLLNMPNASEPIKGDPKPQDIKPTPPNAFIGGSVENTSGSIIPPSMSLYRDDEAWEERIIPVENLGQDKGAPVLARPVTSLAKEGLASEEIEKMREIEEVRKNNFEKRLEQSELRKSVYKHR